MIYVKKTDRSCFEMYDSVSMNVDVRSEYRIKRLDNGLGGMIFEEVPVTPYVKDLSVYERATEYEKEFDITYWSFYMAFDDEKPVGALTVAARTDKLYMLAGREDACVLWDIRVADAYKHQGIGQKMLDLAIKDAKAAGYKQMIIECQNNNVPACKFYHKQGALLSKLDMYAYYDEPDCRNEVQFIWYLDLN
ncbi:MAG: GNAT family N-acetyltransferase [Lachnospiraceae bacterium]|nr:GNAT family N-acetyltransferase [Lachnospiraceae bacterium]